MTVTKKTIKRYIISSVVTFLAMFCLTLAAQLNELGEVNTYSWSIIFGLFSVAARAGFKALVEYAAIKLSNKK